MLVRALETLFKDAEREAREGYGTVGSRPIGADARQIHFANLVSTVEDIPELLRAQAERFFATNELWRAKQTKDLCERVGRDFFPDTAAEFTWRLVGEFNRDPIPDRVTLRNINRRQQDNHGHRVL